MKTTNLFKRQDLFALLFFICLGTAVRAQIVNPYPISNGNCFDVNITYELVDPQCNVCEVGFLFISAGGTAMIGGNCGIIQDVHIVITDINSIPLSTFVIVGDPDPCMIPAAPTSVNITAEAQANGSNCPGPNFIDYFPTGTLIY